MKLYQMYSKGIQAFCSHLVVDSHDYEITYFISICGYQAPVKALVANFLEYNGISVTIENEVYYLTRSYLSYTTHTKKLPSGLLHAVLFPRLAIPNNDEDSKEFFIFTDNEDKIQSLFFHLLDEKTEIPLHPSWDSWLWNMFLEQDNWLYELTTLAGTFKGYRVEFNPYQLQELVSEAIQNKVPEIVKFMKNGDKNYELDFSERILR